MPGLCHSILLTGLKNHLHYQLVLSDLGTFSCFAEHEVISSGCITISIRFVILRSYIVIAKYTIIKIMVSCS